MIRLTPEEYEKLQARVPKRQLAVMVPMAKDDRPGMRHPPASPGWIEGKPARSKHGAVKTIVDGETFDSKHEAAHWMALKLRERAGEIRNLRRQVRFSLFAQGGEHLGTWKADFVFEEFRGEHIHEGWQQVIADAKSTHTRKLDKWERTKTLMMACHGVTVRELL